MPRPRGRVQWTEAVMTLQLSPGKAAPMSSSPGALAWCRELWWRRAWDLESCASSRVEWDGLHFKPSD